MSPTSIWVALGLVLVFEGLMPALAPRRWREVVTQIAAMRDGQIRFVGASALAVGLLVLAVA
ncbi:MAG: DUF2065 domain-containing protein [Burkholderiaceae bacterium]|nr:DUF2065 domain-containing protein [Burkholderiaceae bacterium]